jgi:PAS domain S-box-containing protein
MRSPYDFEHLYQHAACGLILTYANGEIIRANNTFCRYLGYDELALRGKRFQDLFTMGGRFFHYTHWSPLLQMQGSVAEVQMDLVRADGQTIPMLINAFRREFEGEYFHELSAMVASDRKKYERELLTARGAAETALNETRLLQHELEKNRDILSIAMRSAQMGLWSMQRGEPLWCSPELKHILGLKPDSGNLSFENFLALMHEDDRTSVRTSIENAVAQLSDYTTEFRLTATTPHRRMQMRGRAAKDGEEVQIFGIAIDVTELRASELAVNKLNDELAIADRRKDEFLATLAHELRNPLTPILNVSEIIKKRADGDLQLEWASAVVAKQVTQLTHLIDDLMDISRITQGRLVLRKETVRLADVIQQAIEDVHHLIQKQSIDLRVELLNTDIFLSVDPTRLTQIISNLLTNAAKYTPAQGIISLRAEVFDCNFMLWVRDTGIGIAQENLPKIFKMFSQLKPAIERSQGGLGIGLALCRGFATAWWQPGSS